MLEVLGRAVPELCALMDRGGGSEDRAVTGGTQRPQGFAFATEADGSGELGGVGVEKRLRLLVEGTSCCRVP